MADLHKEIEKRRTFAIISHPDAGKTTLTEKFLLYGGAINLAGSVKGKATARHAVSDWMEIEKQRGIELLRKAKECNLGVIAEGQEDCYFPGHISRFDRLESTRRYFASRGIGIEQSLESERFEYDKLFVYVDDKSDFDSFREYLGDDMEALDRGGKAYEVIQKGFSKATACQFIMEKYDMDASHAYVFGDSSNDLAMFEYAEHAIAMGRHDSVLDPYAEFVTKTVENDGIAYAMKHYGLI